MSVNPDYALKELNRIKDTLISYLECLEKGEVPNEIEEKAKENMDRFFYDRSLESKENVKSIDEFLLNINIIEKRREISELIKNILPYL